jgi:hypothetical protein
MLQGTDARCEEKLDSQLFELARVLGTIDHLSGVIPVLSLFF